MAPPLAYVPKIIDGVLGSQDRTRPSLTYAVRESAVVELLKDARAQFLRQPSMLEINPPIQICGDIHGQFTDLLAIFQKNRFPPHRSYLFLGDYVDRGKHQLETIILVLAYKVQFRNNFFLLRGNHESVPINRVYGFYEECNRRYSVSLYNTFNDCFMTMPLSALVGGRIFCMHGGLSPSIKSWNDLRSLERPCEIKEFGLMTDLLWADPSFEHTGWQENSRGISYTFGDDVVHEFCDRMDIDLVARGHQVVQDGYEFFAARRLVTIFSAPKYCGEFDNNGAIMIVDTELRISFAEMRPPSGQPSVRTAMGTPQRSERSYRGLPKSSIRRRSRRRPT